MENFVSEHLKLLLEETGAGILMNRGRLEALLWKTCGQYRCEVNVLMAAVREGVPESLLTLPDEACPNALFDELVSRLHDNLAMIEEAAVWTVNAWMGALNKTRVTGSLSEDRLPREEQAPTTDSTSFEFVVVPEGEFLMGSGKDDYDSQTIERPKHKVFLPEFHISKHPVTFGQFEDFLSFTDYKPAGFRSVSRLDIHMPVVQVSWHDTLEFCRWASEITGRKIRLPTEAEWEKAARSVDGRMYPWGNDLPDASRCNIDNFYGDITPVGYFSPEGDSPYGCTDMTGNTWEWTSSLYREYPYYADDGREDMDNPGPRVLRGCSFYSKLARARVAAREQGDPDFSFNHYSFRIVVE